MNDNYENTELLMRYMDNDLSDDERRNAELLLNNNTGAKEELNNLFAAREAVRLSGIKSQVARVRKEMYEQHPSEHVIPTGRIKKLFLSRFSIAASVLIILGAAFIYEYNSISAESLFNSNFRAYTIGQTRGVATNSSIEDAYKQQQFGTVIKLFEAAANPTTEDYLLTGIAYLDVKNAAAAINSFLALQQKNKKNNTSAFADDAEYYLAMSYLQNNQPAQALPIFDKIHKDISHPYHKRTSGWFIWKLKSLIRKS